MKLSNSTSFPSITIFLSFFGSLVLGVSVVEDFSLSFSLSFFFSSSVFSGLKVLGISNLAFF